MNSIENAKAPRVTTEGLSVNQNQISFAGGKGKRFDVFNYKQFARFGQSIKCRKCQSDYMKFSSIDGYCQDCQQRVEFIIREYPPIANQAKNQRRGATI